METNRELIPPDKYCELMRGTQHQTEASCELSQEAQEGCTVDNEVYGMQGHVMSFCTKLPTHNPVTQTTPDAMHTVKDTIVNIFDLITGRDDTELLTV